MTHLLIIAAFFQRHLAYAHGVELTLLITYKYILTLRPAGVTVLMARLVMCWACSAATHRCDNALDHNIRPHGHKVSTSQAPELAESLGFAMGLWACAGCRPELALWQNALLAVGQEWLLVPPWFIFVCGCAAAERQTLCLRLPRASWLSGSPLEPYSQDWTA